MTTGQAILALCVGLPLLALLIGAAIGSHFGPEYFTGSEDPHL